MTSVEDERTAAQEAETIIRSLVPSTRYAKIIIDKLRKAHTGSRLRQGRRTFQLQRRSTPSVMTLIWNFRRSVLR
jgi:hypothetical protein